MAGNVTQHKYSPQEQSNSAGKELLTGIVERITFHNQDNGFCVIRVKSRSNRNLLTVIGHCTLITAGEHIHATGNWFNDRQHGLQFKADFLKCSQPTTIEGIVKYLGSGLIKGIGPVYAKKLVDAFGESVFEIIEHTPERLREVEGVGPYRSEVITKGWAEQKSIREIMLFLHQHKVSTARAVRIYKTYGTDAIKLILENPYRLARDIKGIGFVTADIIARNVGIAADSIIRARAGIEYGLLSAMDDGHIGLPVETLLTETEKVLEIPREILLQALDTEVLEQVIVKDTIDTTECGFLASLYHLEKNIAYNIKKRSIDATTLPWPNIETNKAIAWVETRLFITLADSQKSAIELALTKRLLVITGGPGVGKTTIINSIITILQAKKTKILLAAPTGRAAKRLMESTGCEAKTIHRLLEIDPSNGKFKRNAENPLDCDLLVIDEMSMVDIPIMHSLLKALPIESNLIIVGDIDQLPSVGPGQVLKDIIESGIVPVARLTKIYRQDNASQIVTNAHRVNQGMMPEVNISKNNTESDFYFIETNEPEHIISNVIELVSKRIPSKFGFNPIDDIQVLCPMHRGGLGAQSLNIELQKALNYNYNNETAIQRFGWKYAIGDKVMQIQNDYDKENYNGDIGFITDINLDASEVVIEFEGRKVTYDLGELDQVVPAYAITIHKSQGSEYPVVIIPIAMQHYMMLRRNLIYTAMTRGKKLVVIIGQKKALAIAVKQKHSQRRWCKLKEWLVQ